MEIDKNKIYKIKDYKFINFINLNDSEIKLILESRNHPHIRSLMFSTKEISYEEHLNFINSLSGREDKIYWLVYKNNIPIGVINIVDIDYDNNVATSGYYIFPDYIEKGIGLEFLYNLYFFFFNSLNLSSLVGETLLQNMDALVVNRIMGCKFDGLSYHDGNHFIKLTCRKDDFIKSYNEKLTGSELLKKMKEIKKEIKQNYLNK